MQETHKPEGQQKMNLDESLDHLAKILRAVGVQELTVEPDSHYHLIDNDHAADPEMIGSFCKHIAQMYDQMMAERQ
jgi:hypothetical protein